MILGIDTNASQFSQHKMIRQRLWPVWIHCEFWHPFCGSLLRRGHRFSDEGLPNVLIRNAIGGCSLNWADHIASKPPRQRSVRWMKFNFPEAEQLAQCIPKPASATPPVK